jgi:hypothetical protein
MKEIMPLDRVLVFDHRLFKDDVSTPISYTMKPATVVRRYGIKHNDMIYPDLIDVVFDHRPETVSVSHFTSGAEEIS